MGHPDLAHTLARAPYAALSSRIRVQVQIKPIMERERFAALVRHALLADSGMELLRQTSRGYPRKAGHILQTAMRLAVPKAIEEAR